MNEDSKNKLLKEALELAVLIDEKLRSMPEEKRTNYTILDRSILYLRVCSSMDLESTLKAVNMDDPTGTEWVYTDEPLPGSGDSRTVQCADAEGKKHYVFNC